MVAQSPRHTAESWRDRWKRKISQLTPAEISALAAESHHALRPMTGTDMQPGSSPQPSQPSSMPTRGTQNRLAATNLPSVPPPSGEADTEAQEVGRSPPLSEPIASIEEADQPQQEERAQGEGEDEDELEDLELQNDFYKQLSDFALARNLQDSLEIHHTVAGQDFGLYSLFVAVGRRQEESLDDVEWDEVAAELGIPAVNPAVEAHVREIFEQHLVPFLEHKDEDEVSDADSQSHEADPLPVDVANPEQEEGEPSHIPDTYQDVDMASSPPRKQEVSPSATKRLHSSRATSTRKRQRLSPNTEIPSTPDERLGIVRKPVEQDIEPEQDEDNDDGSLREPQPAPFSAPTTRRLFNVEVRDSQEDSQAAFTQAAFTQARTPKRKTGRISLETQEADADITPSQQLLAEDPLAFPPSPILRSSPTRKDVVPQTQNSGQVRTQEQAISPPKATALGRPSGKSPTRETGRPAASTSSPRYVPPPEVPPRRSLPAGFAGKPESKAPRTTQPLQRSSSTSLTKKQHQERTNIISKSTEQYDSSRPHPPSSSCSQTANSARRSASATITPFARMHSRTRAPQNPGEPSTIEEWISHYERSYPRPIVLMALKATTMTPGSQAQSTMESLRKHQGIPTNYEGVWTERDDRGALAVQALERELGEELYVARGSSFAAKGKGTLDRTGRMRKEKARLMDKHGGRANLMKRLEFLEATRREEDHIV